MTSTPNPEMGATVIANLKRKRTHIPPTVAAANTIMTANSNSVITNLRHAEEYVKEKKRDLSFDEIIGFLSLQHSPKNVLREFRAFLLHNHKIRYDPKGLGGKGSFAYNPTLPIENSEQLNSYLQRSTVFTGVRFDDIKDGWPNCGPAVDEAENKHDIMVLRDKRKLVRSVWPDDPSLRVTPLEKAVSDWLEPKMPKKQEDMILKLEAAKMKPTSAPRAAPKAVQPKEAKKRAQKRSGKTTNVHIQHLLKDYSHRRA